MTGPHPAQLLRASLGACFVICCRLWAERLALQLDDVTLEIACEYDPIARLTDEATPPSTWERIRFDVTLVSHAAEADLARLVDLAHRHSPMLALLAPRWSAPSTCGSCGLRRSKRDLSARRNGSFRPGSRLSLRAPRNERGAAKRTQPNTTKPIDREREGSEP